MDSKKYSNTKLFVSIAESIAGFIIVFLFVSSGLSRSLDNYLKENFSIINDYFRFLSFVFVTGIAGSIISFPVSYYSGFYLEHKYKLSNQTFIAWIWEGTKELLLSLVIGVPILLIFFYCLRTFGNNWWFVLAIALFVFSVILARIVPVFILPLFYKITPFDNENLKDRLLLMAKDAGLKIDNIYKFNMSKNTKKANAAFTGLGKTKRIILGDTLIEKFSDDEIETVIAHELGHYKKKHIIKNIIIGTISSFLTLYLISVSYSYLLHQFSFTAVTEIGALPILVLCSMVIGLIQTPLGNILSRKYEYEADNYAVSVTDKKEIFINALEKLTEQNLGDKDPHPFVEWFFYSHPSIKNRISAIKSIANIVN
ncbi:MAG: M48 family metallopeptidase [Bacteroidota bacterium]|nr:M48 family metallopeptidase [Bacteroidota bacterium]